MSKITSTILYLTSKSLVVQTEKSVLKTIVFPEELGKESSVSVEVFQQFLENQLAPLTKKFASAVIILGAGVLFQQVVEKGEDTQQGQNELLTSIPFDTGDIVEKTIETKTKTYILATSGTLLKALTKALDSLAIETIACVPLSLFSDDLPPDKLAKNDVKAILDGDELYSVGNFLPDPDEEPEPVEVPPPPPPEEQLPVSDTLGYTKEVRWNTPRLLIILGFLIVLTVLMGTLIFLQTQRPGSNDAEVTPTLALTPTPTEAPEVKKSELTVSVQNGTGTPGQAGKVKTLVEGIGYTSIQSGNADTSDNDKTLVVFSEKVSSKQQQELKELLQKTFIDVTISVDKSATSDIVITTGTEK